MAATVATMLSEDDIYRTSSQYRLWSFTPESLARTRQATIDTAAKRVQTVLKRPVDPLTIDEELVLIRKNCNTTIKLINFVGQFPSSLQISAIQLLKRFYITASCMEYPPSKMVPAAIFLGAKANGITIDIAHFSQKSGRSEEAIIAPEFKLAQGNRFAFDIRTPMRALEGGYMMLMEIGRGQAPSPRAKELQEEMENMQGENWENKVGRAVDEVRKILKTAALLSDAYFLYTPPQIWLGALMSVDEPLAMLYLRCVLAGASAEQQDRVVAAVRSCSELLSKDEELNANNDEEAKRVNQKLKSCTNPETSDLIELNAAQKRDPDPNSANGHAAKKLKTENGKIEDPFGPSIPKPDPT